MTQTANQSVERNIQSLMAKIVKFHFRSRLKLSFSSSSWTRSKAPIQTRTSSCGSHEVNHNGRVNPRGSRTTRKSFQRLARKANDELHTERAKCVGYGTYHERNEVVDQNKDNGSRSYVWRWWRPRSKFPREQSRWQLTSNFVNRIHYSKHASQSHSEFQ